MVVLFYDDGHAEQHQDQILGTPYADTRGNQVVTILTPEEVELLKMEGISLPIGYLDPRKGN